MMGGELIHPNERKKTLERLTALASVKQRRGEERSPVRAYALVFLDEGRRLLFEASNDNRKGDSSVGIAPRPSEFFAGLTDPARKKAFEGLAFAGIGSTIYALEAAVGKGWDDRNYFSRFQDTTIGTPLAYLPTDQINSLREQLYIKNEKGMIEQILKEEKNGTYAPFFESYYSLPKIIRGHLEMFGQEQEMRPYINYAVELYKEIARQFVNSPSSELPSAVSSSDPTGGNTVGSPPDQLTEKQKGFLAGIDGILS